MNEHLQDDRTLDLAGLRSRLARGGGPKFWQSLEQAAETDEFRELVAREFPSQLPRLDDTHSRRHFLRLMGASLAMHGLSGCVRPAQETIVPHVKYPEHAPGESLQFATAFSRGGYGLGVLAKSRDGRPIKIEGNPQHPASLGRTDTFAQASVLGLYDPDRSKTILYRGVIETWDRFLTAITREAERLRERRGAGLRILTETVTSPTLGAQLAALLDELPEARWHQYDASGLTNVREGCRRAFGRYVTPRWHFERAQTVLALDSDFLFELPGSVRYASDFISFRRVVDGGELMNRLYVVESTPTITGARADHCLPLKPSQIGSLARAVLARVRGERVDALPGVPSKWLDALVADLTGSGGRTAVIVGAGQEPDVQAVVWAINGALGNLGQCVNFHEPVEARPENDYESLKTLVEDMLGGQVTTLIILGGNPVYTAPGALDFAAALAKVPFRVHLSEYDDETSFRCDWHVPGLHYLESWSDVRAFDGTVTIVQPLIEPLYGGRSVHDMVEVLRGNTSHSAYQVLQERWKAEFGDDFAIGWRQSLHDGVVQGSESSEVVVELQEEQAGSRIQTEASGIEVEWRPDSAVWDGRFANNAWLQELPRPLSKITWDNVASISAATADRMGVKSGDSVEVIVAGHSITAPAWITPGQADDCVSLTLGYGRTRAGSVGNSVGYSAYAIQPGDGRRFAAGEMRKVAGHHRVATTQDHHHLAGQDIIRVATFADVSAEDPFQRNHARHELPNFYPGYEYTGHAWGMVIDQTACIGCNACMVACQAENNVPVVGQEQVLLGREMHWLRIDRYYSGSLDNPQTHFQPMMCVHCEQAPCEVVCPVAATVHDSEGTNNMIYNRCVGTRYCSNNCPYKVRRFNYLQYTDTTTESLKLLRNPDVTVRSRGVMEKCTYCIQRISLARIAEKRDGQPIADGELVTACQQACPTRAIIFGDLNDRTSEVARLKQSPLNYGVLAELNTRPRTTYLARIRNPHPDLATSTDHS